MQGRLGILSDTHLRSGQGLPPALIEAFDGVDAILHGGDVTSMECLEALGDIAPVYAVAGNNDPPEVGQRCGWRRALEWRGWRLGLVHGWAGPGRSTPDRARRAFAQPPPAFEKVPAGKGTQAPLPRNYVVAAARRPTVARLERGAGALDCIVFGHSHIPFCAPLEGVWMINPGSPTDRRREPHASFVLLSEHEAGWLDVRFFYL